MKSNALLAGRLGEASKSSLHTWLHMLILCPYVLPAWREAQAQWCMAWLLYPPHRLGLLEQAQHVAGGLLEATEHQLQEKDLAAVPPTLNKHVYIGSAAQQCGWALTYAAKIASQVLQ